MVLQDLRNQRWLLGCLSLPGKTRRRTLQLKPPEIKPARLTLKYADFQTFGIPHNSPLVVEDYRQAVVAHLADAHERPRHTRYLEARGHRDVGIAKGLHIEITLTLIFELPAVANYKALASLAAGARHRKISGAILFITYMFLPPEI